MEAIGFAKKGAFDAYVAVGGGSTMGTCEAADLYASSPQSDFPDYVNALVGMGKAVSVPLKPLTAGKDCLFVCLSVVCCSWQKVLGKLEARNFRVCFQNFLISSLQCSTLFGEQTDINPFTFKILIFSIVHIETVWVSVGGLADLC